MRKRPAGSGIIVLQDASQGQATAATAAKVRVALRIMTVRVSISITTWPKRLRDSVGIVDRIMFEFCIGVFSEVAKPLCRRRKQATLRRLRSNRGRMTIISRPD